jgi:hypothetical protein
LHDPTKFAFVINLQTVRTLGIDVQPDMLSLGDDVMNEPFAMRQLTVAK